MKRIYFFMLFCFIAANSFAQRSIDLQALPQAIGSSSGSKHYITNTEKILYNADGTSSYWFTWYVKNLGPDSLKAGDSLYIRAASATTPKNYIYVFPAGKSLKKDSTIGIIPVSGSTQIPVVMTQPTGMTASGSKTAFQWCDSVWSKNGTTVTDPTIANNKDCHTVEIIFWATGVNNVTYEADGFIIYPNPASDNLNIQYDFKQPAKNVSVALRDVIGKVVYFKALGENVTGTIQHNLNTTELPRGMYIAELNFNNQKITSRISIQ